MIKSLKLRLLVLFLASIIISLFLAIINAFLVGNGNAKIIDDSSSVIQFAWLLKIGLLLAVLLLLLLGVIFVYINRAIINPLSRIKYNTQAMKDGLVPQRMEIYENGGISEIAVVYNELVVTLEASNKKMERQTVELFDKNWELQEANLELEASHGQLQAIIEQLNEMQEKYHSLVRNIPEVVCVVDNSGVISFINHVCVAMLGHEKTELIGSKLKDLINHNLTPFLLDDIISELEEQNSVTVELAFNKGEDISILTEAKFTHYIYNGVSMGLQAIIRDITSGRKLEEDIIQSYKELSILNSVSKSLTSTLDLEKLSNLIVNEITVKLGYASCMLGLIDSKNINLKPKAYSGKFYKGVRSIESFNKIRLDSHLIARTINNNEVIKTPEIPNEWILFEVNESKPEHERIKELLFIPVSVKNKKIGALIIGSTALFEPHEESLLVSIANNAAVAVDNALLYEYSKKYFIKTINVLIAAIEAKDKYTQGHSQRVSQYAVHIAKYMGLSKDQIEDIKVAGILHDIGKIGISDSILLKADKLTSEEYDEVKQHPMISNKILFPVGFSERTLKAIAMHHERYDGKGYPYGLKGGGISIEAQIIAVADAFDAMTSNRSYRNAMSSEEALKELLLNKATQFSPEAVDALVNVFDKLEAILNKQR